MHLEIVSVELKGEIGLLDNMLLPALVKLLEKKRVLEYEKWRKKIKEKIKESSESKQI